MVAVLLKLALQVDCDAALLVDGFQAFLGPGGSFIVQSSTDVLKSSSKRLVCKLSRHHVAWIFEIGNGKGFAILDLCTTFGDGVHVGVIIPQKPALVKIRKRLVLEFVRVVARAGVPLVNVLDAYSRVRRCWGVIKQTIFVEDVKELFQSLDDCDTDGFMSDLWENEQVVDQGCKWG